MEIPEIPSLSYLGYELFEHPVLALEIGNICIIGAHFQPGTEVDLILDELMKNVSEVETDEVILHGNFNCTE